MQIFTISSPRREQSPARTLKCPGRNRVQITCTTSSVNVVCHLVLRDSSAIKFDRVEIAFIAALFYWLKPLTDEGGEETGVPGRKTLTTSFNKCHTLKPGNSIPNRDSKLHSSVGGRLGKQTCKPLHHTSQIADQTFYLAQSQCPDTRPVSPSHWYDSTPEKSNRKRDSDPGSSALEEDTLTTRPTRRSLSKRTP